MSKLKTSRLPDIYEKREILGENLYVKVASLLSDETNTEVVSKITGILLEKKDADIFNLLEDEPSLKITVNEIFLQLNDGRKQELLETTDYHFEDDTISEQLYGLVKSVEGENCSKITGMILELGKENIKKLLHDKDQLEMAVKKAKAAIDNSERDVIGEQIFEQAEKVYPDFADKITGMLMEINNGKMTQILDNEQLLRQYIDKAYTALNTAS